MDALIGDSLPDQRMPEEAQRMVRCQMSN